MVLRFVRDSVRRSPRRKALIIAAIAMGSAVATSMLGVMLSIGDKINRELRAVGANIVVTPRAASVTGGIGGVSTSAAGENYIADSDVLKIKNIFWALNITGFAPSLTVHDGAVPVQGVWFLHPYKASSSNVIQTTGIRDVTPAWQIVRGAWPSEESGDCVA